MDNKDGRSGVIIYADKTFTNSSQQDAKGRAASGHIQGPYSSVRAFQFPSENEDTPMECDPPETACNAQTSNVAPPGSSTDEEVPMEVDQRS